MAAGKGKNIKDLILKRSNDTDDIQIMIPFLHSSNEALIELIEKDNCFDFEIGLQSLEDAFISLHERLSVKREAQTTMRF